MKAHSTNSLSMAGSAVLVGSRASTAGHPDDLTRAVQCTFVVLKGLYEDGATEFMCQYRSVPENLVPVNLRNFILNVSLGIQQVGQRTAWKGFCCFAAAACGRFLLPLPFQVCSYRSILYVWCAKLLPRVSEARPCAYCRCLGHCELLRWCQGVRGYYDVWAVEVCGRWAVEF